MIYINLDLVILLTLWEPYIRSKVHYIKNKKLISLDLNTYVLHYKSPVSCVCVRVCDVCVCVFVCVRVQKGHNDSDGYSNNLCVTTSLIHMCVAISMTHS